MLKYNTIVYLLQNIRKIFRSWNLKFTFCIFFPTLHTSLLLWAQFWVIKVITISIFFTEYISFRSSFIKSFVFWGKHCWHLSCIIFGNADFYNASSEFKKTKGIILPKLGPSEQISCVFSSYVQKEHKKTSIAFLLNSYSVVTYAFIHLVNVFQLIFVYLYNFRLFYIDDFSFVILNILAMHIGSIPLQFEYIYISYNVYIYIYQIFIALTLYRLYLVL